VTQALAEHKVALVLDDFEQNLMHGGDEFRNPDVAETLTLLADNPGVLWLNNSSTYSGLNDRVSQPDTQKLNNSLYLLPLEKLKLRVFAPGADFGNPKRRVQADFVHSTS